VHSTYQQCVLLGRGVKAGGISAQWLDGIRLVRERVQRILWDRGMRDIAAEAATFDAEIHVAVDVAQGEPPDLVCAVLRRGYTLRGRVLRPAEVLVGARRPPPAPGLAAENCVAAPAVAAATDCAEA